MTPRWFDDLELGEEYPLPSRTVTEAHFSLFQALSGDNHPIHYDLEYCRGQGHPGLLAHGLQVLAFSAAGAGDFPRQIGSALVAFVEQSSRFLGPVYPGDTLRPRLVISKLERQKTTGVVTLEVTIRNQRDETVLTGEQRYVVRQRPSG